MKHLDLFSGIGGFALGLQWAKGFETVAFCEINKFCQQVLAKNFPGVPIFGDIHELTANTLESRGITGIDVLTGGFPCQPFSVAGRQQGTQDERFLWTELYRVIGDIQPRYCILENVPNLLRVQKGLVFTGILYDLAALGYAVEWGVIPASAIGAPHKRDRLWIIAYPDEIPAGKFGQPRALRSQVGQFTGQTSQRQNIRHGAGGLGKTVPNPPGKRLERAKRAFFEGIGKRFANDTEKGNGRSWHDLPTPRICRSSDGIPHRVDRLESLGNAVVPQLVQVLGERLIEFDKEGNHE